MVDETTLIIAGSALIGALIGAILGPLINGLVQRREIRYTFELEQKKKSYEIILKILTKIIEIFPKIETHFNIDSLKELGEYERKITSLVEEIPPLSNLFVSKKTKLFLGELDNLAVELRDFSSKVIESHFSFSENEKNKQKIKSLCKDETNKAIEVRDKIFEEARKSLGIRKIK